MAQSPPGLAAPRQVLPPPAAQCHERQLPACHYYIGFWFCSPAFEEVVEGTALHSRQWPWAARHVFLEGAVCRPKNSENDPWPPPPGVCGHCIGICPAHPPRTRPPCCGPAPTPPLIGRVGEAPPSGRTRPAGGRIDWIVMIVKACVAQIVHLTWRSTQTLATRMKMCVYRAPAPVGRQSAIKPLR